MIRRADPADIPAIVGLLRDEMGWPRDERADALFAWKHCDGEFGPSPLWVGDHSGRLVALRAFMRWRFECDGETVSAVRAVDTVTRAEMRGRGLFRSLTTLAVEELGAAGTGFIFNTPNDQSRPGYLSMGWVAVGRLPTWVRPKGLAAGLRMVRSRVPAELFSLASSTGERAVDVLGDGPGVAALLASQPPPRGWRTVRSPGYLRWRYGLEALHFRACTFTTGGVSDGVAVYRVRRRGHAVEAAVDELLVPGGDRRAAAALAKRVARVSGADYAICVTGPSGGRPGPGWLRLPGGGPVLTCRPLSATRGTEPADWDVSLGDIEMF